MHRKDIKAQIRKQLKTEYPNWQRLNRKEKKQIARKVLAEVSDSYDFSKEIETPVPELIGLSNQQPTNGILTIEQMAEFVQYTRPTRYSGCMESIVRIRQLRISNCRPSIH